MIKNSSQMRRLSSRFPNNLMCFLFLVSHGANAQTLSFHRTDILTGGSPQRVAVADFNRDGIPDVVVLNACSGLCILLGNGDGTFGTPLSIVAGSNQAMAVGDVNLDGIPDVVTNDSNNNIWVLLGKGDGTFRAPIIFPGIASGLAIGDFNGDGKPDLAATDFPGARIFIYTGHGDGTFSNPTPFSAGAANSTRNVAAIHFSNDGTFQLVAVN